MRHFWIVLYSLIFTLKIDAMNQRTLPLTETLNQINNRCYDQRADYWDRFPFGALIPKWIQQYYDANLGKKVLDIGSGTGVLAEWLVKEGFEVLCLDPSSEMVKRCLKKRLPTIQTSLQEYQTQESFGMIFAILSLIHIPKSELPDQIFKIANMLTKEGLLFLGFIEGNSEEVAEYASGYPRFFATYSKNDLMCLFEKSFDCIDFHLIDAKSTRYLVFVFKKK